MLIVLVGVVAVLALAVTAVFLDVQHSVDAQIRHVPKPFASATQAPVEANKPVNFLILGSDSRISGGDPTDWRYGAQRSDVTMLLQITGDRKSINVMSIPRDSWVPIPGHGTAKINAAYSYGGPSLTINTVQSLTGIPIHHFIVTDFTGFSELTNQLGGVTIDTAGGRRTMDGAQALKFVRTRYTLPQGDFDRVRRQQAWIHAIMARSMHSDLLRSPTRLRSAMSAVLSHSAMDDGLNARTLTSLATSMTGLRPNNVHFMTAPVTGTGRSADGQSIVLLDRAHLSTLCQAWQSDTVADYLKRDKTIVTLESRPVQ